MSNQLTFLLNQAMLYIQNGNLDGSELLLKQVVKRDPNNFEGLRLFSVVHAQKGSYDEALELIDRALKINHRQAVGHSTRGNILGCLGLHQQAIEAYKKAIQISPSYAEAHNNLGNAYQDIGEFQLALGCYQKADHFGPGNPDFLCNHGNALWKLNSIDEAFALFEKALNLYPQHIESRFNAAHINLTRFNFKDGWSGYEWRWLRGDDSPIKINSSKPIWDGMPKNNRLFIWGEQGIGDQILFGTMLKDLEKYPQTKIISVDKKLQKIFERAFPNYKVIDTETTLDQDSYDEHLPMGSLGQFLRSNLNDFEGKSPSYLKADESLVRGYKPQIQNVSKFNCGISWQSARAKLGDAKSIPLLELISALPVAENFTVLNLQYGETKAQINEAHLKSGIKIAELDGTNLFDDIDSLLSLIDLCDLVITSSNSTAHIAGALGKETLLIAPMGSAKFWYWQDVDGVSVWYPSVRVFKQKSLGSWIEPIQEVRKYLENRFAT